MNFLPMESIHPLVVHFPIALLLSAVALDVLALALKRPSIHRMALWNLCLGALAAGAAIWSGLQAEEVAKHSFEIHQVMELHRKLGIATGILAAVAAASRLILLKKPILWLKGVAAVAVLVMIGTLAYGSHQGGRLVYEFGVGGRFGGAAPVHHDVGHEH